MTRSFPLALHLDGRSCLVVGSSRETVRRVRAFSEAGAVLRLIAERPCSELVECARELGVPILTRPWEPADVDGQWLAVLADDDAALAARMAEACAERRVFFCAIDATRFNSFSHLALARAGLVTAAIGTDGQAPALARRLAEELTRLFEAAGLATFAGVLAELRRRTASAERREVLGRAVAGVHVAGKLLLEDGERDGEPRH